MYNVTGDFGQVCSVSLVPTLQSEGLFTLHHVGWHECNDLYQISRPGGCGDHLLLVTVKGCGSMTVDGSSYRLPAGTVGFIPRDVPNSYGTPKSGLWEFYWLHPCGTACNGFLDALARKGAFTGKIDPDRFYERRIEKLMNLCADHTELSPLLISQQLGELLHLTAIDLSLGQTARPLSSHVISYIEQHYSEPIRLEQLAASLFISPAHLIRVFKKENGCTPHQYLLTYRLLMAAQLLKYSDLRVQEIAARVGFSSSSHFGSCFYKRYGCTPVQYQEQSGSIGREN